MDEASEISAGDWIDSSRRLDVVRLAILAQKPEVVSICNDLQTWSDEERLFKTINDIVSTDL